MSANSRKMYWLPEKRSIMLISRYYFQNFPTKNIPLSLGENFDEICKIRKLIGHKKFAKWCKKLQKTADVDFGTMQKLESTVRKPGTDAEVCKSCRS